MFSRNFINSVIGKAWLMSVGSVGIPVFSVFELILIFVANLSWAGIHKTVHSSLSELRTCLVTFDSSFFCVLSFLSSIMLRFFLKFPPTSDVNEIVGSLFSLSFHSLHLHGSSRLVKVFFFNFIVKTQRSFGVFVLQRQLPWKAEGLATLIVELFCRAAAAPCFLALGLVCCSYAWQEKARVNQKSPRLLTLFLIDVRRLIPTDSGVLMLGSAAPGSPAVFARLMASSRWAFVALRGTCTPQLNSRSSSWKWLVADRGALTYTSSGTWEFSTIRPALPY